LKHLYLVRHAKSSWKDACLSDIDRPLNKRGLRNAPQMAERLALLNTEIDLIMTSPACRALSTAEFLAKGIGYQSNCIEQVNRLYFNGSSAMLNLIQFTDPAVQSLMLVGHNPDMTSLLNQLCGYQTDNMPTCAIASIQFEKQWPAICQNDGILSYYDYPKKQH